ncbi:MAG: RNase adapter RapZ, partial [Syntrophomonadaceae bacterium]|nr:RNase adapter RapZ [Syntrophomonadaceae bacterium]
FKESRRPHPLEQQGSLLDAIGRERRLLEELRGEANLVVDTSDLGPRELRDKLIGVYSDDEEGFTVSITSFGFKAGIPMDSDIVMDVRFLPNPFYHPEMKHLTGIDQPVIDFVMSSEAAQIFAKQFMDMLKLLIPYYVKEGKTNLAVAVGCTGGQHRSVVLANHLARMLGQQGHTVLLRHRDVARHKIKAVVTI